MNLWDFITNTKVRSGVWLTVWIGLFILMYVAAWEGGDFWSWVCVGGFVIVSALVGYRHCMNGLIAAVYFFMMADDDDEDKNPKRW